MISDVLKMAIVKPDPPLKASACPASVSDTSLSVGCIDGQPRVWPVCLTWLSLLTCICVCMIDILLCSCPDRAVIMFRAGWVDDVYWLTIGVVCTSITDSQWYSATWARCCIKFSAFVCTGPVLTQPDKVTVMVCVFAVILHDLLRLLILYQQFTEMCPKSQ